MEKTSALQRWIVVSSSTRKSFFQILIDAHLELQGKLRALYPEYSEVFVEIDSLRESGEYQYLSLVSQDLEDQLLADGFRYSELNLFIFSHSGDHQAYQKIAEDGYPVKAEIAANWSKAELADYPFSPVPVIRVGADWSRYDTSDSAWSAIRSQGGYPTSIFMSTAPMSNALRPHYEPIDLRFDEPSKKFYEIVGGQALIDAANDCLAIVRGNGEITAPTTTTPTTETAAPVTVTETEPVERKNADGSSNFSVLGLFALLIASLGGAIAFAIPQIDMISAMLR